MKAKDKEKIAMEVQNILHMNTGDGDSSYACNSFLQVCLSLCYYCMLKAYLNMSYIVKRESESCWAHIFIPGNSHVENASGFKAYNQVYG